MLTKYTLLFADSKLTFYSIIHHELSELISFMLVSTKSVLQQNPCTQELIILNTLIIFKRLGGHAARYSHRL